jgi:methyltransferase (TIGR00027 family)
MMLSIIFVWKFKREHMLDSPFRAISLVILGTLLAPAVEPGLPSKTALSAAVGRIMGSRDPNPKLRNPDYLAEKFLGPREREAYKAAMQMRTDIPKEVFDLGWDEMVERINPPGSMYRMTARTKYFDDAMLDALHDGARQIVILGAGFDSRGYRFQKELGSARFFEVDYGPTQDYKKRRLEESLGNIPEHVHFIAMDFTKDDLLSQLRAGGYSENERSFFIWEGVTAYLPESAVKETLRFVSQHSRAGSRIAFNYSLAGDPNLNNPHSFFALWGEPRVFGMPVGGTATFLRKEGLDVKSDVDLMDLLKKYELPSANQSDSGSHRFCTAQVPAGVQARK